jgi:hypothetical protein
MRQCLFCDNVANSREHVWPGWILKRLNVRDVIRQKMGNDAEQLLSNPVQKIKAVCKTRNSGWMHDLEQTNIPLRPGIMLREWFRLTRQGAGLDFLTWVHATYMEW